MDRFLSTIWIFGKVDRPVLIFMRKDEENPNYDYEYPTGHAFLIYCYERKYSSCGDYIHFYNRRGKWVGSITRDHAKRLQPFFTMKGVDKFYSESGMMIKKWR